MPLEMFPAPWGMGGCSGLRTSGFPGSFFTGPLGSRNIVPNNPTGVLLSTATGIDGNTSLQQRNLLLQRCADMAAAGRYTPVGAKVAGAPDLVGMSGIDQFTIGGETSEYWVHNTVGAIPYLTWSPPSGSTLAQVAAGAQDSSIDAMATRLKALSPARIMFRFFHEFDNQSNWWWMGTTAQNAADFVAAWQHIVGRIHGSPNFATNVGFYWCPTEQGSTTLRAQITNCYPGDTYVDWIGSDSYNNSSGTDSAPGVPGWAEFGALFDYTSFAGAMAHQWGKRKPFVVGETGCLYAVSGFPPPSPSTVSTGKANWYRNIVSVSKASMGSNLMGVMHFDEEVGIAGNDWRVDSNADWTMTAGTQDLTTYAGFTDMAKSGPCQTGAAGGPS